MRRRPQPAGRRFDSRMTALYAAGGLLVLAQILGLYGLKTRKADLVFSLTMGVLVVVALVVAGYAAFSGVRIH